jgi:hypothetical protein
MYGSLPDSGCGTIDAVVGWPPFVREGGTVPPAPATEEYRLGKDR